jgi:hypothetical protein
MTIVPAHKALTLKQFLVQKSITETEHPPYYPDLVLNDLLLFPKTKFALKGLRFQDIKHIQKTVTTALKAVSRKEFQNSSHL